MNFKWYNYNAAIDCKLARMPLQCVRNLPILRYWMKRLSFKNCISNYFYVNNYIETVCKNWSADTRIILSSIGLMNI